MNEMVEMIYRWHHGAGFKSIRRSLGFDQKKVRKCVQLAQAAGVSRGSPFPEESELIDKVTKATSSCLLRETPGQDILSPYREWRKELLKTEHMTPKQVWPLLREKGDISVSYPKVKRYLRAQSDFEVVPVVRGHLLAGRAFQDIDEGNGRGLRWCKEEIGMKIHGMTKRKTYEVY